MELQYSVRFSSGVFIPTVYINTCLQAQCVFLVSVQTILYAICSRRKRGIVFENWTMNNEITSTVSLLLKWPSFIFKLEFYNSVWTFFENLQKQALHGQFLMDLINILLSFY